MAQPITTGHPAFNKNASHQNSFFYNNLSEESAAKPHFLAEIVKNIDSSQRLNSRFTTLIFVFIL
ncbi:hypothetical protein CKO12_11130 [Chromatium okenii]|nr:hypothetical protein [Chromatium okenii]